MKAKPLLTMCLICLLCFTGFHLKAREKIDGDFYIQNYGAVTKERNPLAGLAQDIFKKIYQASDLEGAARLIILPRQAEKWEKWIGVLEDGSVVMVESALDLCFKGSKPDVSKSCLAFILGHELAHLVGEDHLKKLYAPKLPFMSAAGTGKTAYTPRQRREFEKIEEQADFRGLLLMTMAGFNPAHIGKEKSFFRQYQDKIRKRRLIVDKTYPKPEERAERLQNKLSHTIQKTDLFYRGLEKYRRGLYSEAIDLFKSFAKHFNSREVWNNIGLSYYQWAMRDLALLDKKQLMRFRLSTIIDPETLASRLIYKEGRIPSLKEINAKLARAEDALRQALKLDSKYQPAGINLSSTLIRLKQYSEALNSVQEVLKLDPSNQAALLNKALALYLLDKKEYWKESLKILQTKISLNSGYYSQALYNSNIIREEQLACATKSWGEKEKLCLPLWKGFLRLEPDAPHSRAVKNRYKYKERRVALVIGNSDYEKAPLNTPWLDAVSMAAALHDLGFEVSLRHNMNRDEMKKAVWDFGDRLKDGGVGLFYYSGHGAQIAGKNYLIPLKAKVSVPRQADLEFVRMDEALAQMEVAGNRLNIVLMDACRNNPFTGLKSGSQGLGMPANVPQGTIIGYATAPGGVALGVSEDGHSPYTKELLEQLKKPGLKIEDMFKKVRRAVARKTNGLQKPWETTSLEGDFYFNPPVKKKSEALASKQTAVVYREAPPSSNYSWVWHSAAVGLAAGSLYVAYQSDREYESLNQDNRDLKDSYDNDNLKAAQRDLLKHEYDNNERKMKDARVRLLAAGSIAVAALIWEAYLLLKNDDRTKTALKSDDSIRYSIVPEASGNIRLSLSWGF